MGYEVIGVNMRLWQDPFLEDAHLMHEGGCCSLSSVEDARRVCAQIGIPFYALDFKTVFKETVVDYFISAYEAGETPNPCIACNKFVKFDALLEKAKQLGAHYVATGHYAKIAYNAARERYEIHQSNAAEKDQTYALYNLTQAQLAHILMPLGNFQSKDEVRAIAAQFDVQIAGKSDSQEICFIPDDDYVGFLTRNGNTPMRDGEFVSTDGTILGRHQGIARYTVGQRKGLGITFGKPMYVVGIDAVHNRVILGENEAVFSKGVYADTVNFIPFDDFEDGYACTAKIRYSAKPAACRLYHHGDGVKAIFESPQRAVTPGQAIVFYNGSLLVGGGTIRKNEM
jgi:tRNA-specific 2-thiouridylase